MQSLILLHEFSGEALTIILMQLCCFVLCSDIMMYVQQHYFFQLLFAFMWLKATQYALQLSCVLTYNKKIIMWT